MKKVTKRILPLILSVVIAAGSVFGSYEQVQATGITDILYYTYWDLISTIYAQCGYSTTVDADVINNHGVTGKQVWDNFCTSVENTAKFHYGILNDAKEQAIKDLKNLAKTATAKGIKLTQDLYDMLRECFSIQNADVSSFASYTNDDFLRLMGASDYKNICSSIYFDSIRNNLKSGYKLNVCADSTGVHLFASSPSYKDLFFYKSNKVYEVYDSKYHPLDIGSIVSNNLDKTVMYSRALNFSTQPSWIIKEGVWNFDATIKAAQVSEGACPQEVPEVTPWHKEKDIPDGWRVVPQEVPGTGGDQEPDKDPDKDPDKKPKEFPDVLPGTIPLFPFQDPDQKPAEKPDSTEDPAKDPDKEPAKEPAKDPGILVNPQTGNLIDPNTGLDIDPKTGKLIDPETGELIDPGNLPDSGGGSGGDGGGGGLPGAVSGFGDITKLFPFCIPFDMVRLIKGMQAKEAAPKFHFEYHFDSINYTFVVDVDLTDYAKYIKIFRFGMQVFYAIALMLLTIKVSKLFV